MSTLTSSSTYAAITNEYEDNASWYEDESVTKAKAFVTACMFLIRRVPKRQRSGDHDSEFSVEQLQKEMERARDFISARGRDGSAKSYRQINAGTYR